MSKVDYQKRMDSTVTFLEEIYQEAPPEIIEKYRFLFNFLERKTPVMTPLFTYYPAIRIVENEYGVVELTKIHHRIFYLLAKNIHQIKYVPRDYIYSVVFRDICNAPHFNVIHMHFYNLSQTISKIGLRIGNARKKGSFIEIIPENKIEKNTDWKPFVLKERNDDPFNVYPW